jgi:ATP adenylyltransferase
MDYLWTPWRSAYMKAKKTASNCIFCNAAQNPADDEKTLVVFRGQHCFVILNRYPYTTGHLMVVPYDHVARLELASEESTGELMILARQAEQILQSIYKPDGLNLGMNVGAAAGAGIHQHLHLHVLPRWTGDANFMTTVADARILPEALEDTYRKVSRGFVEQISKPGVTAQQATGE